MTDIADFRIEPIGPLDIQAGLDTVVVTRRWLGVTPLTASAAANTPPTVTWVSPAPGTPISPRDAIVVDIGDDVLEDLSLIIVSARFESLGLEEVVFRGEYFASAYAESEVSVTSSARFTLRRRGGWPGSVRIQVDVVDGGGERA